MFRTGRIGVLAVDLRQGDICPAIVGPEFEYDSGPRVVAYTDDEIMSALGSFPNMRMRVINSKVIALPEGADTANAREEFVPSRVITGLFQLRPGPGASGTNVFGDSADAQITIVVEIDDPKLDLPASAYLERQAIACASYLPGVKADVTGGEFRIELATGVVLDPHLLGEVIASGLRLKFPQIGPIQVRISFGKATLDSERAIAAAFARRRDTAIRAESDDTVDEFHLCIDCQPFSHRHVCVITPDHPPMCGRTRDVIKAGALWGVDYRPWTRRDLENKRLQYVVAKGEEISADAGEWSGVNAAVAELSDGKITRVCVHSVCDAPHTSCGCFRALAFKIPGIEGIGVMDRSYKGSAPGGLTWSKLANRAAGKQAPGVTGISLDYLESARAFAGEGGLAAVKWATEKAYHVMAPHLTPRARVATEADATTTEELLAFLHGS